MKEKSKSERKVKLYFLLIISLALLVTNYSCGGTKRIHNKTEMNQTTILTANFDVSAKTRLFIKDVQDELFVHKTSISKYVPSKNIIDKYNIIQIDNIYHISGMMMTNETFEKSGLNEIGVKISIQSGNIATIQIPVNNFDLFLKNQGITYFQISEKVKTK